MQAIGDIFNDIQENNAIPNKSILSLIEHFRKNQTIFINALEQCFLKIMKSMIPMKAVLKRQYEIFEKLTEKLFSTLYATAVQNAEEIPENSEKQRTKGRKRTLIDRKEILSLFHNFINFFSDGLEFPQTAIKVFCAREIGLILRILTREELEEILDSEVAKNLISGIVSLLRQKSNVKILGLKLASFLQHLTDFSIQAELGVLKKEMLKCMCCEENREIRKVAISNIQMTEETFEEMINRTREIDISLRLTIYSKLIKEKISLEKRELASVYKIAYDGLYSRDENIRKECIEYLKLNFYRFEDISDKKMVEEASVVDETTSGKKKRRFSTPKRLEAVQETKSRILDFFSLFHIENALLYPHLYQMLELLVTEFLNNIVTMEDFSLYLKDFLLYDLQLKGKANSQRSYIPRNEELFLVRVLCSKYQQGLEENPGMEELFEIIDECFPNGLTFINTVQYFHGKSNLFGLYQCLLLAEMLINCDETSRNCLLTGLRKLCLDLRSFHGESAKKDWRKRNDLFYPLTDSELENLQFAQSYFEIPIIRDYEDLVPIIVQIFRKLIGDQHNMFSIQIIQLISEIREPLHNYAEIQENEDNLQNKLLRAQKELASTTEKFEEISSRVKELKRGPKLKRPEKECDEMINKRDYLASQKTSLETTIRAIEEEIFHMNRRCLQICLGLLQRCRISLKDPGLSNLLTSFIGPLFKEGNKQLKDKALQCLALWVLHDKKHSEDYFPVFTAMFDCFLVDTNPANLICLKFLFDYLMIYNYDKVSSRDLQVNYDLDDILNFLIKFMFKGEILIQKMCIEGFCRLLFNDRLPETDKVMASLIVIWNNSLLVKKGGYEGVQILSTFFRNYQARSIAHLENFERGLESVVNLALVMISKHSEFLGDYVYFDLQELQTLHNLLRVGIDLMGYNYNKENMNLKEFRIHKKVLFPQERFFIFLTRLLGCKPSNHKLASVLDKVFNNFDFFNFVKRKSQATILKTFIEQLYERDVQFRGNKFFQKVMKKIEQAEISGKDAEKPESEGNGSVEDFEKWVWMDDEDNMASITETISELNASFKEGKSSVNRFWKNLEEFGLLTKKGGEVVEEAFELAGEIDGLELEEKEDEKKEHKGKDKGKRRVEELETEEKEDPFRRVTRNRKK